LRILFWSANFWPNLGGLERISQELVLALRDRGVEVLVVAPQHPNRPDEDHFHGVPVRRLPFQDPRAFLDLTRLFALKARCRHIKQEWAPDIVHISGCSQALLMHQLTLSPAQRTLITLHGAVPGRDPGIPSVYDQALRQADALCCCSQWTQAELIRNLPDCAPRCSTVLNALPLGEAPAPVAPDPVLLCAGRLAPEKGYRTAIAALPRCHPKLRLEMAGEGPLQAELGQLARQSGVRRRLRFLGRLGEDELYQKMQKCLAVLVPSRDEGFGLTALEAAWLGVPVVASRVGGLPEVVLHNQTGLLVHPTRPHLWAKACNKLYANPDFRQKLSEGSRAWARSQFSWSDFVDRYMDLYRQLVT